MIAAASVVVGFLGYEMESVAPPIATAATSSTAMARSTVKSNGEVDGLKGGETGLWGQICVISMVVTDGCNSGERSTAVVVSRLE